jgi:hypothetical protein
MGLGILAIVRQQSPFRVGIFSPVRRLGRFEFLVLFGSKRKHACNRNRNNAIDAAASLSPSWKKLVTLVH